MTISRSEGYRRGADKAEGGLVSAEAFFREAIGVLPDRITGEDDNPGPGDFRFPTGRTMECKRQPIDPSRYKSNFVEVFELVADGERTDGFARLGQLLDVPVSELEATRVLDYSQARHAPRATTLGRVDSVSVSIESIAGSDFTLYVNPDVHIYIYLSDELMNAIRYAMVRDGLRRGMGRSNDDTFAALVDLAGMRWSRLGSGWRYVGEGAERAAVEYLRTRLGQPF